MIKKTLKNNEKQFALLVLVVILSLKTSWQTILACFCLTWLCGLVFEDFSPPLLVSIGMFIWKYPSSSLSSSSKLKPLGCKSKMQIGQLGVVWGTEHSDPWKTFMDQEGVLFAGLGRVDSCVCTHIFSFGDPAIVHLFLLIVPSLAGMQESIGCFFLLDPHLVPEKYLPIPVLF